MTESAPCSGSGAFTVFRRLELAQAVLHISRSNLPRSPAREALFAPERRIPDSESFVQHSALRKIHLHLPNSHSPQEQYLPKPWASVTIFRSPHKRLHTLSPMSPRQRSFLVAKGISSCNLSSVRTKRFQDSHWYVEPLRSSAV
jgi:hypothetical protein